MVCVPGPLLDDYSGPRLIQVELRLPDGSCKSARLSFEQMLQRPPPKELRWACLIHGAGKQDVPIGTQVWTVGEP